VPHRLVSRFVVLALFAATAVLTGQRASRSSPTATVQQPPRLLVIIVADQFRGDYARTYGHQWSKGLRRLFSNGAVFPLAAYPYAGTVTCPGHASISTGAPPAVHGLIGNDWYDRTRGRTISCTDDPDAVSVGLGGARATERHSLRLLKTATLADELRRQSAGSRVAAISLKPRSAITLAGQPSPNTTVVWEEDNGTWATSSAYAKPPAALDAHVSGNPVIAAYGHVWERLLRRPAVLYEDDAVGEPAPRTFPHALTSPSGQPDAGYVTRWERSPLSDAYLTDLAIELVEDLRLGQRDATDMLTVSYSALDLVGHRFGPRSHEVQEVLARLDVEIGRLLAAIDRIVGADRYTAGFSADHGVALVPEQAAADGIPAGRISSTALRRAADAALNTTLGPGTYVAGFTNHSIYLARDVGGRIASTPGAARSVENALLDVPGVAAVYWASALASTSATGDSLLAALRLSYVADRSGDLVIVPRPFWIVQGSGTTHGSPYTYDQQVPVVFFGARVRAGRYFGPASPLDLAPTLAHLAGAQMPQAAGRVLAEGIR
jgi:predicted AlkP superfamily pyrophosphatase or phosphodiesterase